MYWYLTVRSDPRYEESVPSGVMVEYLDSVPHLRRTGVASYQADDDLGWLCVIVAACDGFGNYAAEACLPQRINMVELICSMSGGHPAKEAAQALAAGIADRLGWEVADSDSDELLSESPAPETLRGP